jgi:prepilin peptidase CpaA
VENYLMLGAAIFASIGAFSDVRARRIPNWLNYSGLLLGLLAGTAFGGWRGLFQGVASALIGGGVFFLFYLVRGMGAGDVKLMAAVGAWLGIRQTLAVMMAAAIAGGILAIIYVVFYRRVWSTVQNMGELIRFHLTSGVRPHPELNLQEPGSVRLPYGLAIAFGTVYLLVSTGIFRG